MVSSLHATSEDDHVSVRMTFCGLGHYMDAKELVKKEDGWEIDDNRSLTGSEMVVTVKGEKTVVQVVDRMHEIGLSAVGPQRTVPAPSPRAFG